LKYILKFTEAVLKDKNSNAEGQDIKKAKISYTTVNRHHHIVRAHSCQPVTTWQHPPYPPFTYSSSVHESAYVSDIF